jgi:hypothetical protein
VLYTATVPQFVKMLRNLDQMFDKALAWADTRKFDPAVLLSARLAPDQFPLARQVQIACDTAKLGVARITGREAPVHADDETTIPQLRARIASVISWLEGFGEADFAGAAERTVTTPRWEGKTLTAQQFAIHHAIPNFYFHVATAYAILRHNGVDVGKRDYLGPMPFKDPV